MGELLLELLSEEIPARMQDAGIGFLEGIIRQRLLAANIPAAEPIESYVTPRRMVIIAHGVPDRQPDQIEERRGPRVGAPKSAVEGFLRSSGLLSFEELTEGELPGGRFYFAQLKHRGVATNEVLREIVPGAIIGIPWPKSMRWPGSSLRWVRPLSSVICLFDGEVVPLALDGMTVIRTTRGHRCMAPGAICVDGTEAYVEKMRHAHVILDKDRRREVIRTELDQRAAELGVALKPDPGLLHELTGLAEFPVVLAGAVDPDFMSLPPEVLATAMRTHQRYFSCVYFDGRPAPHFLFVADNVAADGGKTIVAGNERVLRARLADARFFWDQDRKVRLEDRVGALKDRIYHERLGSVFDKVERMGRLVDFLVDHVPGAERVRSHRAVWLAKADLSTGMVGEFPELQGIMGRHYALHDGEVKGVANAIAEHYKPLGPNDTCPSAPDSVVAALAERIDTLAAFFAIGEPPTGSRDPYALRRAAIGIVRLVLENNIRLSLGQSFALGAVAVVQQLGGGTPEQGSVKDLLLHFIADRVKVHLRDQGVRHDLIAAVFAVDEDDLVRLLARVDALGKFLQSEDGANLLTAYRRAANIVAIEERRDHRSYDDEPDWTHLLEPAENTLARALPEIGGVVGEAVIRGRFDQAMSWLATLRRPVDEFFAKVTVNTDAPTLRENRLRLLSRIRATMNRVADFSQIEG